MPHDSHTPESSQFAEPQTGLGNGQTPVQDETNQQAAASHPPRTENGTKAANGSVPVQQRKFRISSRWLYALGGLGAVGLIALAFRPAPVRVDLVTVERADLQVTVDAEGKTRVQDRFVVAAPVDGRLARIELSAGDEVEQGSVIAQIDPIPYTSQVQEAQARIEALRAEIAGVDTQRPKNEALAQAQARIQSAQATQRQAEAALAEAQAELAQARRDRNRADALASQGAIPEQDRESARLTEVSREQAVTVARQNVESAIASVNATQSDLAILQAEQQDPDYLLDVYQAEINQVEAELARLADDANRTEIQAPVSGRVLRIPEKSARYVTAGTELIELGDAGNLELIIDVLSTDAVKIQPGDAIQVSQWGGDDTILARVRYVEPSAFTDVSALGVEEQRVNVIADFVNAETAIALGDGYRVETQIVIDQTDDVLTVPISAVFPCDAGSCVFAVDNNRAYLTPVTTAARNTFDVAIANGLAEGDTVIAYPETVTDGARIQPR